MVLGGQGFWGKEVGTFDRDDELREDGEKLVGAFFYEFIGALAG